MKKKKSFNKVINTLTEQERYDSYFTKEDSDELEELYSAFGGRHENLYNNSVLPEDYLFDPKNPPVVGCTELHPPLQLAINEKAVEIYGSSCKNPIVKDADIYISLDYSTPAYDWEHPWVNTDKKHIRLIIVDGSIPENNEQFNQCIDYTINALEEGKKVHVGCIAGHGRTGLFLAALAQKTIGKKLDDEGISAIDYVRDTYCANAVENLKQVLFLTTLHGVAIPKEEKSSIIEFEKIFHDEIGVEFKKVINDAGFYTTLPIIKAIDAKMFSFNNKYMKSYTKTTSLNGSNVHKTSNYFQNSNDDFHLGVKYPTVNQENQDNILSQHFQTDLTLEPNSKVSVEKPPVESARFSRESFSTRLTPEKFYKLQAFKLKR